ncbi:MAG: GDSL-type esterase/lipase family protein [Verrucomicrobiales bacterium]|jgi:lysophospholipase L1-like esterase|nr:GDSL-type esterase/lipase family protein [Verrucomicrobiales bacterium]
MRQFIGWKILACAGLLAAGQLFAAIKVACVGDSITAGSGLQNPREDAYPAQLGKKLGAEYEVRNFGVSGRTLLNHGDYPFTKEPAFRDALAWQPDIVVIALGTNDGKPQNYEQFPKEFAPDYQELIKAFRDANSAVKIYVCTPPPVWPPGAFRINGDIVAKRVAPLVRQVAREEEVELIDLQTALRGKGKYFPDKVHPNPEGAGLMAGVVAKALTGQDSAGTE